MEEMDGWRRCRRERGVHIWMDVCMGRCRWMDGCDVIMSSHHHHHLLVQIVVGVILIVVL
jgi:hypothetical protein